MKPIGVALAGFCLLASGGSPRAADDRPADYAAQAPIEPHAGEGLQRLVLPLAVLQASRSPALADVRIFDAQGQAVPIAWTEEPATPDDERLVAVPRFAWPQAAAPGGTASTAGVQVEVNADGHVIRIDDRRGKATVAPNTLAPSAWLLDLSAPGTKDEHPTRLELDWAPSAAGLSSTVHLEGSDDAQRWQPITQGRLLELPGQETGAPALKHIEWPAGVPQPRYLRLHSEQPLALTRSVLRLARHATPRALERTAVRFEPVAAAGAEPAYWQLDLLGAVALRRLELPLQTANSLIALRLDQRQEAQQPWAGAGHVVAWRLQRGGEEAQSGPFTISAPPARYWRLVPDARTPGTVTAPWAAWIEWRAPELVFVAAGGGGLTLAVGRDHARSQAAPLSTLIPNYTAGAERALPAATVGSLIRTPARQRGWVERLRDAGPEDHQRWTLWAVLVVAVAGLGALAWRLGREVAGSRNKP